MHAFDKGLVVSIRVRIFVSLGFSNQTCHIKYVLDFGDALVEPSPLFIVGNLDDFGGDPLHPRLHIALFLDSLILDVLLDARFKKTISCGFSFQAIIFLRRKLLITFHFLHYQLILEFAFDGLDIALGTIIVDSNHPIDPAARVEVVMDLSFDFLHALYDFLAKLDQRNRNVAPDSRLLLLENLINGRKGRIWSLHHTIAERHVAARTSLRLPAGYVEFVHFEV